LPIPISHLFRESLAPSEDIHCIPNPKDLEEMALSWDLIGVDLSDIPNLPYPSSNDSHFDNDINTVMNFFINPVNNPEFLKISDDNPFQLFKRDCKNKGCDYDFDYLDKLNEQLARLVLNLKFKYNRPRPKRYMKLHDVDFNYDAIEDNKSPSYPSGHSAHAYFNAGMISNAYPELRSDLTHLADRIAQSRIDLGKHYPSDISFGKFLGELACKMANSKKQQVFEENRQIMNDQEVKIPRQHFIKALKEHNSLNYPTNYCDELCEFIIRSNAIERYKVDITETYDACKMFLNGLPAHYCSSNLYIRSHLSALDKASELGPIDNIKKVTEVHKALGQDVLERGESGILRPFKHMAGTGYEFSKPDQIIIDLNHWCHDTLSTDPLERHIIYECIHPFSDGNGRSGRIIMASDLNFDFYKLNDLIGDNYINSIVEYQNSEE
jgi:hypothetical protein